MTINATVTDATHLVLAEPLTIPSGANIQIIIEEDAERDDFLKLSSANLERAYGDDEPEYTTADIMEN
jgi:hypothetical protein